MATDKTLSEKNIDPDPFNQFKKWYDDHLSFNLDIPNSVSLATATKDGAVSLRTVLLKEYSKKGFVFYTNYKSRKGIQLLSNPKAALLFYWPESARQIRIEGLTEVLSNEDSISYFKTRPKESQLSAWASEQSSSIPDREYLENRYLFYKNIYSDMAVPKPEFWGGFCLTPEWFEFWQEGNFRLHDRLIYVRNKDRWAIKRLAP
jgi:pyridoxamine 5'-phosphate oxidase